MARDAYELTSPIEVRRYPKGVLRRTHGVRELLDSVGCVRMEEEGATTVEGQLEGDRNPLRPRALNSGD